MRKAFLAPLAAVTAAASTACSSTPPIGEPAGVLTPVSTVEQAPVSPGQPPPPSSPAAQPTAREAFSRVLNNPGAYPPNPAAEYTPTGTYSYALVEATGDSTPELLLKIDSREYSPVLLFVVENGQAIPTAENIIAGHAASGGFYTKIAASRGGRGVYEVNQHSVNPDAQSQHYVLQGHSLVADGPADHFDVTWFDSSNRSGLDLVQGQH